MNLLSLCRATVVAATLALVSGVWAAPTQDNALLRKSTRPVVDESAALAPERPVSDFEPVKNIKSLFTSVKPQSLGRAFKTPVLKTAAIQRTVSQSMPVCGNVIYSSAWSSWNPKYNISSIPTDGTSTKFTQIAQEYYMNGVGGSVYTGDFYYVIEVMQFGSSVFPTIYKYDTEKWEYVSELSVSANSISTDMAYDSTTGNIYGCFYGDDSSTKRFGTIDMATGKVTEIKQLDVVWNAIAVNAKGEVYALDKNGDLFFVDKTNGDMTKIGNTGLAPYYVSSAAFDQRTGRLYYSYSPEDHSGSLWEINPATAAATKIFEYENREEVVGMWVPLPLAEDEAPAAVASITPEFIEGSLSGTVNFTAPAISFYGEQPLTGELTYTVTLNGEVATTGTTTPGAATSAKVTAPAAGMYEIMVTTSNSYGPSPVTKTSLWIGNDTPKAVKNVKLEYVDGVFNLTWDPATDSNNGGYIDPLGVTYTVTRYPDETVVAESLKGVTSFSEPMADPDNLTLYYYTVAAAFNGETTTPTASNRWPLGSIVPPYTQDFSDKEALGAFTIINVDGDTRTWEITNGMAASRYNTKIDTDNWLITPPVKLQADNQYTFSFDAKSSAAKYTSHMEVWFGTAPTVDGMTTKLLERTNLPLTTMSSFSFNVNVGTSGTYYFAIRDCSDTNGDRLYVDDMAISAGINMGLPAAPANMKAVPDYNGELNVTISGNLPTVTIADKNVAGLVKAELTRDGEVICTVDAPMPGAEFSYTDADSKLTEGRHTYALAAYTEAGKGIEATVTPYVGINMPTEPTNVGLVETAKLGEVTLSWETPKTDVDGNPLNPEFVSYIIMGIENEQPVVLAEGVKGNSWTKQALATDAPEQDFVYYGIAAETKGGISDPVVSPVIAVGPAYQLPLAESFADTKMSLKWVDIVSGKGYWQIMEETTFSSMGSQDGDNGYVCYRANSQKEVAQLRSGKISVTGKNPTLTYWYHPLSGSTNVINTKVIANGVEKTINSINIASGTGIWDKVLVDLSAYTGQTVQLAMEVEANIHLNTSMDNFNIFNRADYDVSPVAISAPTEFNVGTPDKVTVDVENVGAKDAAGFVVALYLNGQKVDSKTVDSLAPEAVTTVEFEQNLGVMVPEQLEYYAVVEYETDENAANNTSVTVKSSLIMPRLAWVTDLAATASNGTVKLTWSAPDANALYSQPETEGFETYETYSIANIGKWTLIDVDQSRTFGVQDVEYPNNTQPMAYMVFGGDKEKFPHESMRAHSGDKFLACFGAASKQNDDWLVSPRLNGKAQTISFYAKTYNIEEGYEKFEVLYTTSTTIATDQFVKVADSGDVPGAWTMFEYEIPAGAQYFAIRCTSQDCYILMIDDITYTPAVVDAAVLVGYNVYRNGVKVNDELVKETSFADNSVEANPVYVVTAVYAEGESRPSNAVTFTTTGVETVDATTGITVAVDGHNIVISNAAGATIAVFAADGRAVYTGQGTQSTVVTVAVQGVYVVKAGDKVVKVAVR